MKKVIYEANIHFKLVVNLEENAPIKKEVIDEMVMELFESEIDERDKYELNVDSTMEVSYEM